MELRNYETVFILNPVLSEAQMKDTVAKFKKVLTDNKAEIVNDENWGLKKLAYTIQHKTTGFYQLFEFKGTVDMVDKLEIEYRREEPVMRFLTTVLDKHAIEYNRRRQAGAFKTKTETKKEEAVA